MLQSDVLIKAGIRYDKAVARCFGDESLLQAVLEAFLEDDTMEQMHRAYSVGNYTGLFRCAHTMKGTSGNAEMGLLFEKSSALTELLRNQSEPPKELVDTLYREMETEYTHMRNAILEAIGGV